MKTDCKLKLLERLKNNEKIKEFVKNCEENGYFSDEDNFFKCETSQHLFFCEKFPLTEDIVEVIEFDWKNKPLDYDNMLFELDCGVKAHIQEVYDFKTSYIEKQYLKAFMGYLYEEFFDEFN